MNAYLHKWIKNTVAFLLLSLAHNAFAQVPVSHKAGWFYIPDSLSFHIKGGLSSLEGNEDPLLNLGQMYISDSISCYGDNKIFGNLPDTATADIYLNGDSTQIFSGNKAMRFGNLYVQNTYDSLEIKNTVEIYHFLDLQQGNIFVHDFSALDFINTGVLIGERNQARIYGDNYGEIRITRPLLFGRTYSDIGGLGFGLTVNGNLGISTEITRKNVSQLNVSNGSIDRFYTFKPEKSAYVSNPEILYLDSMELNDNVEGNLEFYISNTNGNTWNRMGGEVDTVNHLIRNTSADPFVLSDQTMLSIAESKCLVSPYLEFLKDTIPLCGGEPAWLRPEGINGMSNVWSNGVENKDSILVDEPGVYYVTITDVKGCSSIDSIVVINAAVPQVSFSVDPVCVGTASEFVNASTISSGTASYRWQLGDLYTEGADTSTQYSTSLVYQKQGAYQVTLTATSNYGCVNKVVHTAKVNAYPVVSFSMSNDCADSLVLFSNETTVLPDTTITYSWKFGDSETSTDSVPLHAYPTAGTYQVELSAISQGCESVLEKEITIHPNPVARFAADDVCLGQAIQFTNESLVPANENTYQWQFEGEREAVLENPEYNYEKAGVYAVALKATSDNGCMHDTIMQVEVYALPTPDFMAESTCEGAALVFSNNGDESSTYSWNLNDEETKTDFAPSYTFDNYGAKQVILTETDSNACVASISKEVYVKAMPKADFISTNACQNEELTFINKSVIPEGNMNYNWYVDEVEVGSNDNLTKAFATSADYKVKLLVNSDGCVDSVEHTSTVFKTAELDLGTSISTCADQYVLDAQNSGSDYVWSNASYDQELTVTNSGSYWVEVTTADGCVSLDTVTINLKSMVNPQLGDDATFCDEAELNAGYPGADYLWSTGETTQRIQVTTTGTYWVQVTDQNGCSGRDTIVATIVSSVVPKLGNDIEACEGQILDLESGFDNQSYLWNTGENSANIKVSTSGSYWCEITDNNGCVSRDTIALKFNKNPGLNLGEDKHYCDEALFDISGENLSYVWDNGAIDSERAIYESGKYWAKVTDNATGCVSEDTVEITLSATPTVSLGEDLNLCNGSTALLDAGNAGFDFKWNVGESTQTITASATGLYTVQVTSPDGCVAADTVEVAIDDPLDTYLGEDFVLCTNTEVEISSPIAGAANYHWSLNDSALNINQQTIIVNKQGSLSLTVETTKGCTVSDTIMLNESPTTLNASYLAATSDIYVGDTIQFINMSEPEPYTSYWEFGDGYFSNSDNPEHIYYFKGEYRAMLEISNGVCVDTTSKVIYVKAQRPAEEEEVEELNEILSINAFPNPTTDQINLKIDLKVEDEIIIECFNVYGISIFNDQQYGKTLELNYQVSSYMPGIYFLRVRIPDQTIFIKFIKN